MGLEDRWGGVLEEVLAGMDLLFCTERELTRIAKLDDLQSAVSQVSAKVPLLVVKRGARGASA